MNLEDMSRILMEVIQVLGLVADLFRWADSFGAFRVSFAAAAAAITRVIGELCSSNSRR